MPLCSEKGVDVGVVDNQVVTRQGTAKIGCQGFFFCHLLEFLPSASFLVAQIPNSILVS